MVRLRNIKIKNFKCFSEKVDLELGKITLLTGANSTGKSSFMYSFLGAMQSPQFPFVYSVNGRYVNMGDFSEIVYSHDKNLQIEVGFTLEENEENLDIVTTWANGTINDQPELVSYEAHYKSFDLYVIPNTNGNSNEYLITFEYKPKQQLFPSSQRSRNLILADIYRLAEEYKAFHGIDISDDLIAGLDESTKVSNVVLLVEDNSLTCPDNPRALMAYSMIGGLIREKLKRFKQQMNFISSYRLAGERFYLEESLVDGKILPSGKGFVNQLLNWRERNRERYEAMVVALRGMGVLYDIEPMRIEGGQFKVGVTVHKDGPSASLSDVGFGISQLLPVIVGDVELGDGSTLFSAQPEIHLHPNAQANLADYFIKQIDHGKNYVIETHSEYLLNRIRLAVVKGNLKADDIRVYYLSQEKDATKVYTISFTKNGQILGAPKDFFETYMLDVMNIAMEAE